MRTSVEAAVLALLAVKEPLSRTAVLARLPDISPKALDRADPADHHAAYCHRRMY